MKTNSAKLFLGYDVDVRDIANYLCSLTAICSFCLSMLTNFLRWYFANAFSSGILEVMLIVEVVFLLIAAVLFISQTLILTHRNKHITYCTTKNMPSVIKGMMILADIWVTIIVLSSFRIGGMN